ncbi:MAG: hypothetical protein GY799_26780 [Desulfobulbaceae bacterium]|nr:hypothetical protein [Desulfobulbaceae bacterium]
MGEIFGGIIVMAAFIGFIIWKNKHNNQQQDKDPLRKQHEEEYWAEKNASEPDIVSSNSNDD